jgi:rhodanese-related sulfurtransferase
MSIINLSLQEFLNDDSYRNIKIIDVRTDDFIGGNIPNAINIKCTNYYLIKQYVEKYDSVIIHCMYSQIRGAGVANRLKKDYPNKKIILLSGGFSKYFNHFINIKNTKIENLNMIYWKLKNNVYKHIYD